MAKRQIFRISEFVVSGVLALISASTELMASNRLQMSHCIAQIKTIPEVFAAIELDPSQSAASWQISQSVFLNGVAHLGDYPVGERNYELNHIKKVFDRWTQASAALIGGAYEKFESSKSDAKREKKSNGLFSGAADAEIERRRNLLKQAVQSQIAILESVDSELSDVAIPGFDFPKLERLILQLKKMQRNLAADSNALRFSVNLYVSLAERPSSTYSAASELTPN